MKYHLLGVVALFLVLVTPALANRYDIRRIPKLQTPPIIASTGGNTKTNTHPTITNNYSLCINYGHQPRINGQYDPSQVAADISYLKAHGITCIRTADMGTNSALTEALALQFKNNGYYVQVGNDADTLSPSNLSSFDNGVIAEGKWAQANGIPEMSLANEQEYRLSGITIPQWIAHLKTLATQVRAIYGGKISYATSGDFTADWIKAGNLGSLDIISLNLYCGFTCNNNYLSTAIQAFGLSHVAISEISCDITNVAACKTDAGLANEIKGDLLKLHALYPTVPMYFFAFRSGGTAPAYWGLFQQNGVQYPITAAMLGL